MKNKKHIVIIGVLCVIALGLGYVYGKWRQGSGQENAENTEGKEEAAPKEPEFLKQGLVAYYPFNGNAKDESGNGHDDTLTDGASLTDGLDGEAKGACLINGTKQSVQLSKKFPDMASVTVSAWVFLASETNRSGIVFIDATGDAENDFVLSMTSSSIFIRADKNEARLGRGVYLSGNAKNPTVTGLNLSGWWTHIVWAMKPDKSSVYVNGIRKSVIGLTGSNIGYHEAAIGNAPKSLGTFYPLLGKLDEIRIYNRALSDAEVKALYDFEKVKE